METKELCAIIEEIVPLSWQEGWDNSGVQVDPGGIAVAGILFSLDCTCATIHEAVSKKCQAVISHHPLVFKPLSRLSDSSPVEKTVIEAIRQGIFVYSLHTPLDQRYHDRLTRILGLQYKHVLVPNGTGLGYGSFSYNPDGEYFFDFLKRVKEKIGAGVLIYGGDENKRIFTVAILNGSGGGKISAIIKDGAVDCVITGDVSYHQMQEAVEAGVAVIDAGHFGTEKHLMVNFRNDFEDYLTNSRPGQRVKLVLSEIDQSPMKFF